MDSINDKKITDAFPFDALRTFSHTLPKSAQSESSDYTARSYDNRGRLSDLAMALQSKLGYFKKRLLSSSFLSESFSWQTNTARTSDPDRLLAKAGSESTEKDLTVDIGQLAGRRKTVSNRLDSNDAAWIDSGTYGFSLQVNDDTYEIGVDVVNEAGSPATNRSVLRDIERAINRLGVDVEARLTDTKTMDYTPFRENVYKDVSALIVESKTTGKDTIFYLSDTDGTVIEDLGLNKIISFGQQNRYHVNGSEAQSDSNEVEMDDGLVTAHLLDVSKEDQNLQINIQKGNPFLAQELEKIIYDFNELINWIDENDYALSPSLKSGLFSSISTGKNALDGIFKADSKEGTRTSGFGISPMVNHSSGTLFDEQFSHIGLELNHDGTIDMGEDFASYVSSDLKKVYDVLAGTDGFFSRISQAIDTIHDNSEKNYVFAFNSVLSYTASGENRRSIYQSSVPGLINYFA